MQKVGHAMPSPRRLKFPPARVSCRSLHCSQTRIPTMLISTTAATRCLARSWLASTASSSAVSHSPPVRHNSQHRVYLLPEVPPDTAATNPLLRHHRDGLAHLDAVTERNAFNGLGKAILEFEAAIGAVEDRCQEMLGEGVTPDFDAVFQPLEEAKCQFEAVFLTVHMLHMATDTLDRDRAMIVIKRAERSYLSRFRTPAINAAAKRMQESHDRGDATLDSDQLRVIERYLVEHRLDGFDLDEKKREALHSNYLRKLGDVISEYNYKTQWTSGQFRSTVSDPNVVRDFPLDVLKAMALDASQPAKGPWTVTLHPYVYRKFLEYCPERVLRWNAYRAKISLGSREFDVSSNVASQVKDIRQYRNDQAVTLGFANYADFAMERKMAANVENVHSMIACLLGKAKDAQEKELTALQEYAETRGFDDDLSIFDVPFFKQKQRRTMLGMTDEDLRDYFPLPRVLTTIFHLCSQMFDVNFEEVKQDVKAWHKDVKLFRVIDASGRQLGHFYLDAFLRDDKAYIGGDRGWYMPLRSHSVRASCEPLGAMVMSLPLPGYGKPCLLNLSEVQELMGLFGNLMLHMCSDRPWSDLSGKLGIEQDAAEVAKNFFVEWLYTPEFMSAASSHWSSNQPLPDSALEVLCASRQHMAGLELCTELFKAAFDITFYTETLDTEHTDDIVQRLYPQYLLLPMDKDDSFPLNFTDVLGSNLQASYYSSTWSKMLAADAFSAAREIGLENKEEIKKVCRRFRSTFLASGCALPAAEVFRQFRGRDPSHEALLLALGLKDMPKPKRRGQQSQ